jgi:hypothetical protein
VLIAVIPADSRKHAPQQKTINAHIKRGFSSEAPFHECAFHNGVYSIDDIEITEGPVELIYFKAKIPQEARDLLIANINLPKTDAFRFSFLSFQGDSHDIIKSDRKFRSAVVAPKLVSKHLKRASSDSKQKMVTLKQEMSMQESEIELSSDDTVSKDPKQSSDSDSLEFSDEPEVCTDVDSSKADSEHEVIKTQSPAASSAEESWLKFGCSDVVLESATDNDGTANEIPQNSYENALPSENDADNEEGDATYDKEEESSNHMAAVTE